MLWLKPCPSSVLLMNHSFLKCRALTSCLTVFLCRSCLLRCRRRAVLYPHHIPHSPVKRSPARARTCPATRNLHLRYQQPAQDPWVLPQLRSPSTGSQAEPQTRRAALGEMHPHSVSASCPATLPSGTWRKFMSSSVRCQVSGVNRNSLFRKCTRKALHTFANESWVMFLSD